MLKKEKRSHFVIQCDHCMALTGFYSCDLSHAVFSTKKYRNRTAAKRGQFWKMLVKSASFVKCRF